MEQYIATTGLFALALLVSWSFPQNLRPEGTIRTVGLTPCTSQAIKFHPVSLLLSQIMSELAKSQNPESYPTWIEDIQGHSLRCSLGSLQQWFKTVPCFLFEFGWKLNPDFGLCYALTARWHNHLEYGILSKWTYLYMVLLRGIPILSLAVKKVMQTDCALWFSPSKEIYISF